MALRWFSTARLSWIPRSAWFCMYCGRRSMQPQRRRHLHAWQLLLARAGQIKCARELTCAATTLVTSCFVDVVV